MGSIAPDSPDAVAHQLLADTLAAYPETTLVTGAPLHNPGLLLARHPSATIKRWVGQGGFAGENIVPPADRLAKFAGKITCPTFNFGGAPTAARPMLDSPRVLKRDLVSKNVCHGVIYDLELHRCVEPFRHATPGLQLLYSGMNLYLKKHPAGNFTILLLPA